MRRPIFEHSIFDTAEFLHPRAPAIVYALRDGACPTQYFEEASSIHFTRSVRYGIGVLATTACFVARKLEFIRASRFCASSRKVNQQYYTQLAQNS